jgi:hypothetical protein
MSPEIEGILREGFSSMLKAICAGVPQPDPREMWERFRREELGPMIAAHPLPPLPRDEETACAWGDYMHAWLLLTLGMRARHVGTRHGFEPGDRRANSCSRPP